MTGMVAIGRYAIPIHDRHVQAPVPGISLAHGTPPREWRGGHEQSEPFRWACRIEDTAEAADLLTSRRGAILDLLLKATRSARDDDRTMLEPIWANETFERVYFIVELLLMLDHRMKAGSRHLSGVRIEHQTALRLAGAFRLLNDLTDRDVQPCCGLLRDVVRDLVELFGPAVGDVVVKLDIERLALPQFEWRALILAAGNLVLRALLHAFRGRSFGVVQVSLRRVGDSYARLIVADDGCDLTYDREADGWAVLEDLTAILDSRVAYRRANRGGTIAEIVISGVSESSECLVPARDEAAQA